MEQSFALVGDAGGGQAKWNALKLGATASLDHSIVLQNIKYTYDPADPKSFSVLHKDAKRSCPYTESFPKIQVQKTIQAPSRKAHRPALSLKLPKSPEKLNFQSLNITAPKSPTKQSPKSKKIIQEHSPKKNSTSWMNVTSPRGKPKFIPSIATQDRVNGRQFALAKMQIDGHANQLSKHEKSGRTLKSTLDDEEFNFAILTVVRIASQYASIGDGENAWIYRCFSVRALGDRYIQSFIKNLTLQFYDDAVSELTRACAQFKDLQLIKAEVERCYSLTSHSAYSRQENEFQCVSDRDRFILLSLEPLSIVKAFASHCATNALRQAYIAISDAKSRTGSPLQIRLACEMLSIAYSAFTWLQLNTDHLSIVHSSIDVAQQNSMLTRALVKLASNRHKALLEEWTKHHRNFTRQAERLYSISKSAESLRVSKDVTIAQHIASTNLEKRVMAAVIQVLQGIGGNFVARDHSQRVHNKRSQMKMGISELRQRRKSAKSGHVDSDYMNLIASKRRYELANVKYEEQVYCVAATKSSPRHKPLDSARQKQAEMDQMDKEAQLAIDYELEYERQLRLIHRISVECVEYVVATATKQFMSSLAVDEQYEVATHIPLPDAPFFELDMESQRKAILAEIEHYKAVYSTHFQENVSQIEKLRRLLHEKAFASDASEFAADEILCRESIPLGDFDDGRQQDTNWWS
ncbi:hypothetical protein THRCLA_05116 [Thraustotheca clavata]|uniref:Uncharacterized protein n=1 Tax=Thraustotheca clavata TaxID=74557 RepID=A0A1V9ZWW8_9STRA|nr:hypothetical protein THRCLA_05116 [Thraustotheca clavata]